MGNASATAISFFTFQTPGSRRASCSASARLCSVATTPRSVAVVPSKSTSTGPRNSRFEARANRVWIVDDEMQIAEVPHLVRELQHVVCLAKDADRLLPK